MGAASKKTIEIPALCQFWRSIANSLPVIRIFGLDVSVTLASALVLTAVRFSAEYAMVAVFGWPDNSMVTKNAAASVAAIFHSLQLVPALAACFLSSTTPYNPSQKMSDAAPWWQETVSALLQFCTGYMLYDGLLNIVWLKTQMNPEGLTSEDYMFLGHHLATTLYMSSTRIVGAGHQSAMICMLLGELTNPLHNSFYIGQAAQTLDCCNGAFSQAAFAAIEVTFSALYCFIRAGIGPFVFLHVTYNTFTVGRKHIPMALIFIWNLLIWAVVIGSIPWIHECWATLQRYYPTLLGNSSSSSDAEL